jgi:hypothetical protein
MITGGITKEITKEITRGILAGDVSVAQTKFISTWLTTNAGISANDEIALPVEATSTFPFDVIYNGSVIKTVTAVGDNVVIFPDGSGSKTIEIDAPIVTVVN